MTGLEAWADETRAGVLLIGPLLDAGWTLQDIRSHSIEDLKVAVRLLARYRLVREPMSNDEAGKTVREHPELADAVNRKLEEQRRIFGE